jgi:FkbM family methyltransferase
MSQYKYFSENNVKVDGVIHVGAHRGEEIYDYEKLGAKQVIWVEPNPDVFKELEIALSRAETTVESHGFCVAASDSDCGEIDFHICYGPDAGFMTGNKGCSSLLRPKGRFEEWHRETIKVETVRLDTLIESNEFNYSDFQLLDMDTQGAELLVLKGATKVLENVNYVTTEATWNNPDYVDNVMFDELKDYLKGFGFEHAETFEHTSDWGDALFVKTSKE